MYKLFDLLCVCFMADGGGNGIGAGTTATGDTGAGTTAPNPSEEAGKDKTSDAPKVPEAPKTEDKKPEEPTPPPKKKPAYFAQFSPEKRDSEDYSKYLDGKETITDVADAYIEMAKKSDRSITIPGKDASREEMLGFLTKLGVPETADGYELKDEYKAIATQLHKLGLTKSQGRGVSAMISELASTGMNALTSAKQSKIDSFDSRFDAALAKTYPNKSERETVAKETMNLFKKAIVRTGLGATFEKTGLIYDESFVMKIAADEKSRGTSVYAGGATPPAEPTGMFQYGDSFKKQYSK